MRSRYVVVEDQGGGLQLFVFDTANRCVFARGSYEHTPGLLSQSLTALVNGSDVVANYATWDTEILDAAGAWEDVRIDDTGYYSIVAMGIESRIRWAYANMGPASMAEFGVSQARIDSAKAAQQLGRIKSTRKAEASRENGKKGYSGAKIDQCEA